MNYLKLTVPQNIQYLSQWRELLNHLPEKGNFILNKVRTGCGGTTLFLEADIPLILVSPRTQMLYSKAFQPQFSNVHLFRGPSDTSARPPQLQERLRDYINTSNVITPWGNKIRTSPKILVTVDSYKYVAEQLYFMGILDKFHVVVDEFQCLMSDAKFKGKTDLEFLCNLSGVKTVCYLSATPIPEAYIEQIPEFSNITDYIELKWMPELLEKANLDMRPYGKKENVKSICSGIIKNYKKNGWFAQKWINGQEVNAREVVFFINDVKTIVKIIEQNNLKPWEVNVLCSLFNKSVPLLKKLGVSIGRLCVDRDRPVNPTYTFVTRAAFEGVDFYSASAFTYIFSDGVLDWNKHDLITDVPQIMGRQRLATNPFWKDAVLYYRPNSFADTAAVEARIRQKESETEKWIQKYNTCDDQTRLMLKSGVVNRDDKKRYDTDYVEFIDDINGGFQVKKNELVMFTEIRDLELSRYVFNNPLMIVKTVTDAPNINVISQLNYATLTNDPIIDNFNRTFFSCNNFPDKMKLYMEVREQRPGFTQHLYENSAIEIKYHQFYDILGKDTIIKLGYREKDLRNELNAINMYAIIKEKCSQVFLKNHNYRLSEIKETMQKIYNEVGIKAKAKAGDLNQYMNVHKVQLKTPGLEKRELYLRIL